VLVLDDLHWAEAPLLDLVEHLADWAREAPIFLLCIARPELLDVRPGWGGGKLNATSILLEPLGADDAVTLVDGLLEGLVLDGATRSRILATAEGNPLFLEEMAALAREVGGSVEVPPTIQALLQARLDTLDDDERIVIERGAVEGKVFHRGAVTALAPDASQVDVPGQLLSLMRKELVRPDHTQIAGDDAFRFRHLLIRDTAYEGLPKAVRAELHELFAEWLDAHGELIEQQEIVGYHLEQAARYRLELDRDDPRASELAMRAAACLGAAGRGAFEREDFHATRSLLERALALAADGSARCRMIPELVYVLIEIRGEHAEEHITALLDELARGDSRDAALATALRIVADPTIAPLTELLAQLDEARSVLDETTDPLGVALCEEALALIHWGACQAGEAHRAYRRAYTVLRNSGQRAMQVSLIADTIVTAIFSGTPVSEVHRLVDDLQGDILDGGPLLAATVRGFQARIDYGAGLIDRDDLLSASEDEIDVLRQTGSEATATLVRTYIRVIAPWLESDAAAVEQGGRERCLEVERLGPHYYRATTLATWALGLCDLGDREGALDAIRHARKVATDDDLGDQIVIDAADAYAHALGGERRPALELLERAQAHAKGIDMVIVTDQLDYVDATVRALLGDLVEARELLTALVERANTRGLHRWADRYRRDLDALD